jgi:uroporphyrinogen III methyltransferase/synthase
MSTVGPPRVFLLGAGPGDPELITRRAARRLGEADVVLYDALVHPDLLALARPDAERTFVGKRAGRVSERQEAIHRRIEEAVLAGKTVARLKGGDPYLFGRGSEEAEFLASRGIPFEVVPGVPSPIAASAYAGLSMTHREAASSIAYVTATESVEKDRESHDWAKLATATETIVFFMGLRKLGSLMQTLVEHGRPSETPAAVVEKASLPSQRTVVGTVGTIARLCEEQGIGTPALTIVGEVVRFRERLRWFDRRPLFGARVLVMRPEGQVDELVQLLRDESAEAHVQPVLRILPPTDPEPFARAVSSIRTYGWVVLTSANGVDALFAELARTGRDARALADVKILAIGPATAARLERHGVRADLVPTEFRGEAAASALLDRLEHPESTRVLVPRAEVAREALPAMLTARGVPVDVVASYRTAGPGPEARDAIAKAVREREIDVVTVTSPSSVERLLECIAPDGPEVLEDLLVASIGPVTTEAALRLGVRVDATATEYTSRGLVEALSAFVAERGLPARRARRAPPPAAPHP